MFRINKKLIGAGIACLSILAACEKTDLRITEYDLPADKAYARFVLLSPGTPSVMIKVNDAKINGANTSGSLGVFPSGVGTGADYAAIPPNSTFRLSLPNIATANDSVLIFSGSLGGMSAGKNYTVLLADTASDRTVFAIEDVSPSRPDSGFMSIRFVNAMAKTGALSLIRVDSASTTVVTRDTIIRDVPFKQASNFVRVPIAGKNPFVRYRMILSATGQPVGGTIAPTTSISLNYRAATIYGGGFGNGTGTYVPFIVGLHINK
jgi:hypothetical protein